jgi:putative flippase GtrA
VRTAPSPIRVGRDTPATPASPAAPPEPQHTADRPPAATTVVLIPAYEPGGRLVDLVRELQAAAPGCAVVVVDDGSGPAFRAVFDDVAALGGTVLRHDTNRGKGAALRTGFAHVAGTHPGQDVVCADCDGQHAVDDVLRVADRVRETRTMVLGGRTFSGRVPVRSRFGNTVTRALFRGVTGSTVRDTQTGLRGYPAPMLDWLQDVPGDRFEYELNLLLRAPAAGHRVDEIPIRTIYLEGNASSHFRPLVDSARVYAPLLRYALSSLASAGVDAALLVVLQALTGSLAAGVVGARLVSSTVNFLVNRRLVFDDAAGSGLARAAAAYWALAATVLLANLGLMEVLTVAGFPLLVAKVVTESTLWATTYVVQRRFVFPLASR